MEAALMNKEKTPAEKLFELVEYRMAGVELTDLEAMQLIKMIVGRARLRERVREHCVHVMAYKNDDH
jgi:hypothetical protein